MGVDTEINIPSAARPAGRPAGRPTEGRPAGRKAGRTDERPEGGKGKRSASVAAEG